MNNNRYSPPQDGQRFRHETFLALAERYRPCILGALEILHQIEFEFPEINKAHVEQLRPDLLFRHALPFCVTEETFFELEASSSRALAGLLAGHTLALTHLDYHLDGSSPDPAASATALKMEPATAIAYSIRMVYAAGRIFDEGEDRGRLFRDALDPISGFVVSRMHQDWRERYSSELLQSTTERLEEYLHSPLSRLQGSGYWEVMARGSFARHSMSPPESLLRVLRMLRTLRQVVDEIADFDDDISAGLVTAPLMFALEGPFDKGQVGEAVQSLWRSRTTSPGSGSDDALRECRALVGAAGGFAKSFEFADSIWRAGASLGARTIGSNAGGFLTLLDLKRAKLEELSKTEWRNTTTETFFA